MKKAIYLLVLLTLSVLSASSCTKLNSGDSFICASDGVDYKFEVIVSKMNYVRVSPVAGANALSGNIVIPAKVRYDGHKYIVTQIAEKAFADYSLITSVELPSTLSVIEDEAFRGCVSLTTINTPQPLSSIGEHAFEGCEMLKKFSLDASISTLEDACFKNCVSLTEVKFPASFSEIPDEAFYGCVSLTSLELSSTIMKIGDDAFGNCTGLRSLKMDRSVQSIGSGAFWGCQAMESITCLTATPPTCSDSTFEGVPEDIPVTVPMPHVEDYRAATGWNHFSNFTGVY